MASNSSSPTDPSIAGETSCQVLRWRFGEHLHAWKAGVRYGKEDEANLATMREILRRLEELKGCGG